MYSSKQHHFLSRAFQFIDFGVVALSFYLGEILRDFIRIHLIHSGSDYKSNNYPMTWMLVIATVMIPFILGVFGFYRRYAYKTLQISIKQIFLSLFIAGFFIGMFMIFARYTEQKRLLVLCSFSLCFFMLLFREFIALNWFQNSQRGNNREKILLIGNEPELQTFKNDVSPEVRDSWNIVGNFEPTELNINKLYSIFAEQSISRVMIVPGDLSFSLISKVIEACEFHGIEAWVSASFIKTQVARPTIDNLGEKPMFVLRSTPELTWELMAKNAIDWFGALALILCTLPLWIIAAIGIRFTSPGAPVFFSQMRAGRYGEPFKMWKFRTMVANAPELLEKIKQEHGNQMEGPVFKLDNDPRIFKFGAILRKFSIDELPQLINVLKGEISLVGPRPLPLYEVEAFSKVQYRRRLSVKPGITGEWQAGGRNTITSFEEWVQMDLNYIDKWSIWLDIKILLKTVPAVLLSKGAK